jgi:predicted nuclease with TOPRIM domain
MNGIPNPIANAVRAVAYLIEEMEENAVNELVRNAVLSQMNELMQDMKSLVEDAKDKISEHIKEKLNELTPLTPSDPSPLARSRTPTDPG